MNKIIKISCLSLLLFSTELFSMEICNGFFKNYPAISMVGLATPSLIGYQAVHSYCNTQINIPEPAEPKNEFIKLTMGAATIIGLALGLGLAATTRVGPWPKIGVSELLLPALGFYGTITGTSLLGGYIGYKLAKNSKEAVNECQYITAHAVAGEFAGCFVGAAVVFAYFIKQRFNRY